MRESQSARLWNGRFWRKAVVGARSLVTIRSYFPIELEHRGDCWNVHLVRHAT
jgi:hypothetical protein